MRPLDWKCSLEPMRSSVGTQSKAVIPHYLKLPTEDSSGVRRKGVPWFLPPFFLSVEKTVLMQAKNGSQCQEDRFMSCHVLLNHRELN